MPVDKHSMYGWHRHLAQVGWPAQAAAARWQSQATELQQHLLELHRLAGGMQITLQAKCSQGCWKPASCMMLPMAAIESLKDCSTSTMDTCCLCSTAGGSRCCKDLVGRCFLVFSPLASR